MRYEHQGNARKSSLAADIDSTAMSFSADPSTPLDGWPDGSVGPFWGVLGKDTPGEEKVLFANRSANLLNVFTDVGGNGRGKDQTTAQSHPAGTTLEHVWTATEADEANAHVFATDGAHGYPPANTLLTTSSVIDASQVPDLEGKADIVGDTFTGVVHVLSATGAGSHSARETFISTIDPVPADGQDGDMWVRFNP